MTRRELWDLGVPPILHQLADGHQEVDVADLGLLGQGGDEGLSVSAVNQESTHPRHGTDVLPILKGVGRLHVSRCRSSNRLTV